MIFHIEILSVGGREDEGEGKVEYKPKLRGKKEIHGKTERKQSLNNRKKSSQKLFHSV